jgi:hypothetical protein
MLCLLRACTISRLKSTRIWDTRLLSRCTTGRPESYQISATT